MAEISEIKWKLSWDQTFPIVWLSMPNSACVVRGISRWTKQKHFSARTDIVSSSFWAGDKIKESVWSMGKLVWLFLLRKSCCRHSK